MVDIIYFNTYMYLLKPPALGDPGGGGAILFIFFRSLARASFKPNLNRNTTVNTVNGFLPPTLTKSTPPGQILDPPLT